MAVQKAAARRIPAKVPPPATRRLRAAAVPVKRPRPAAAPRPAVAAPAPAPVRPPQSFTVSHLNEADFKMDGLRPYALYRDLGIAAATSGLAQAHVIRFIPPTTDEVRKRHTHTVDLQLVYVLKGWIKNEFEGHGEQMMSAGSCWIQPSGIAHTVLEYSPDCEVLEIILPADFATEEVA
ncbi:MAG: cupin domain-containing protein [Acetobacteraceae bacterium]